MFSFNICVSWDTKFSLCRGTFLFSCALRLSRQTTSYCYPPDDGLRRVWGEGGMILNEEQPMYSEKYLSSCYFAQEKVRIDWPGVELGHLC